MDASHPLHHPFELDLLREQARRALFRHGAARAARPGRDLAAWLWSHADRLGVKPPGIDGDRVGEPTTDEDRAAWAAFARRLEKRCDKAAAKPAPPSDLERRLRWLVQALALDATEADLLGVAVRVAMSRELERLLDAVDFTSYSGEVKTGGFAALTGRGLMEVTRALLPGGSLRLLGLLRGSHAEARVSGAVLSVASQGGLDPSELQQALVGPPRAAILGWDDFRHLGEQVDLAERCLSGALEEGATGVNILLHGAPGAGKTEFAAVLAERLGARAVFVGESDRMSGEPGRDDRIAAFILTRALARQGGKQGEKVLLVVDEAEEIFVGVDDEDGKARVGSKVFMNRIVETSDTPTLWITNHPERLGAAVLRRMSMALHFAAPGQRVRREVIGRLAQRNALALDAPALDTLAAIEVAPAVMENAIRVAALARGGGDAVAVAARSVQRTLSVQTGSRSIAELTFDPRLSSADQDLTRLAERIADSGEPGVSLCLHGPSGTGKSAFARHLAQRLGLDVMEVRASDLLSKWVGETEARIADAFRTAAEQRAMLIFDEADSLLRDRQSARTGWEVTQVNEMLTWMEAHPLPFACTTNLMDSLDPATLRRFLFKVRFLPMTAEQARDAFQRAFGVPAPVDLADLSPLAPADFAVAARKARVLGLDAPDELVELLRQEVALKPGAMVGRIGF